MKTMTHVGKGLPRAHKLVVVVKVMVQSSHVVVVRVLVVMVVTVVMVITPTTIIAWLQAVCTIAQRGTVSSGLSSGRGYTRALR